MPGPSANLPPVLIRAMGERKAMCTHRNTQPHLFAGPKSTECPQLSVSGNPCSCSLWGLQCHQSPCFPELEDPDREEDGSGDCTGNRGVGSCFFDEMGGTRDSAGNISPTDFVLASGFSSTCILVWTVLQANLLNT